LFDEVDHTQLLPVNLIEQVCATMLGMSRKYEQRKRADQQEETRQRITRAAMELHGIVGPARTSLSAVAERAGVQRNTLYRHFPDESSLLAACSGMFMEQHPLPDPGPLRSIADPVDRARRALEQLYAYWEETEATTANVVRDAEFHEPTRRANDASFGSSLAPIREAIAGGWPRGRQRKRLVAAVDLATHFRTWQSLVRHSGLTRAVAADLMAAMLDRAATVR
jgi:AcrR family transcriptional regulator